MDKKGKIILVTGATGKQGGAAARHLLSGGWQVRGLTRDPDSDRANELRKLGAEMVQGNLDDRSSLDRSLEGVYGAYSVQQPWEHGLAKEVKQGKRFADAAKAAGVEHFVYSSVGSANQNTGVPHFESKWEIEQHIRDLGLRYTILRPVFFMENLFAHGIRDKIFEGTLALGLNPDTKLQIIAVEDIGEFAARAFESPEEYGGRELDLAGDELTGREMAAVFSRVLRTPVSYSQIPIEQIRGFSNEYAIMYEWFNNVGYDVEIATLRRIYPELKTLDIWIEQTGWKEKLAEWTKAHVHA